MPLDPVSSNEILNEAKALTPEIYQDVAKPALQEIGSVAGRTVRALLAPVRGLLWGWDKIEEFIESEVTKRLDNIPEENKKSPDPEIAVPLLQALTYTAQNETLRDMYVNLLANSMNSDKINIVHPSFVEIIKQMNSLDAKVFDRLATTDYYQKILNARIVVKGQGKFIPNATPEWYAGWSIEGYSEFEVSASLIRLSKFGLVELMFDRTAGKDGYEEIRRTQFLQSILSECQRSHPTQELEIGGTESIVYVNEYGMQFKNACK